MVKGEVMNETTEQQLHIQKVYLKDLSYESPKVPKVFTENFQPSSNFDLNVDVNKITEDTYEVVLHLTVSVQQDNETIFLIELQQAGIFTVTGFDSESLDMVLGAYCPAQLYPFAREAVADLTTKGGFLPLLIDPVNFDALYKNKQSLNH